MKDIKVVSKWLVIAFLVAVALQAGKDSYKYFVPDEPITVIHKYEINGVAEDCSGGCG